jgi:hypothetical protein|tara:strand:+ start:546 stop:671 length:126 start_codon:yes stop_codon:yes gene_type:complete
MDGSRYYDEENCCSKEMKKIGNPQDLDPIVPKDRLQKHAIY